MFRSMVSENSTCLEASAMRTSPCIAARAFSASVRSVVPFLSSFFQICVPFWASSILSPPSFLDREKSFPPSETTMLFTESQSTDRIFLGIRSSTVVEIAASRRDAPVR